MKKSHVDKFDKIIPVFKYGTEEQARGVYAQMDRAIKKATTVIQKHSMFIRKKERCAWIDDCYLLMGKSHFYKQDYFLAVENFETILKEFKKEPIRHNAGVWLARSHIEMENYSDAKTVLNILESAEDLPGEMVAPFWATKADYYLKQDDLERAVDPLTKAIAASKKRRKKTRWMFILAQVHQKLGNLSQASELYGSVVKRNPKYEMAFNAKINRAKTYSSGDSKSIRKELSKMLKDDKNIEFLDQIYYALANIDLKEGKVDYAIINFDNAVQSSTKNQRQKGLAYLSLGEIYFEKTSYQLAQAYYDSAATTLPKEYEDYEAVKNKKDNLADLVKYHQIVDTQDSLLTLAKMDTLELLEKIDGIIAFKEKRSRREATSKA